MAKAKVKKERVKKDSFLKDNYVQINDYNGVITEAMHIRTQGCLVRERNTDGTVISSVYVPGVKIKTKKDLKYLIVDKILTEEEKAAKKSKRDAAKAKKAKKK